MIVLQTKMTNSNNSKSHLPVISLATSLAISLAISLATLAVESDIGKLTISVEYDIHPRFLSVVYALNLSETCEELFENPIKRSREQAISGV